MRHLTALGRSARFKGDNDLSRLMQGGWAASITVTQCDAAFSEDMRAVLAPDRRLGTDPACLCRVAVRQEGGLSRTC